MLVHVAQQAFAAVVAPGLVGGANGQRARCAVECGRRPGIRISADSDVRARAEGGQVVPAALLVRREVYAPFVAADSAGFGCATVGSVVAGHNVTLGALGERYVEAIVSERVRRCRLARVRAGERDRDPVPFLELT